MDRNFFDYLYPIDYISKLSALSHFSYDTQKLTKRWVTYSMFLVLLMNVLSMYQLNLDITNESNTKLFKFVSILRFVSPTVSKSSICITYILKYKTIMRFLNCVNDLETVIEKGLKVRLANKCYVKLQLMVIFAVVSAVSLQILLTAKTTGLMSGFLHVFNLISLLCQVQFICCVLLLNQYITVINVKLSKLCQIKGNSRLKTAPEEYIFYYYGNFQNRIITQHSEQTAYLCKELVRIINIVRDNLNSFFSFPILLIIADNLLLTTFNLYMLIKNMSLDLNSDEFLQQISYLYDVSLNIIQIICIAFPCANTDNEVSIYVCMLLLKRCSKKGVLFKCLKDKQYKASAQNI